MILTGLAAPLEGSAPAKTDSGPDSTVVVTASRRDLIGVATSAGQGSITQKEIELRPIYRPGQLFESVPGLIVTIHSGEGKAQQYLIRGYNLDHGTDFANFVDDMPVNRPSNAHGQGYSDISFLIPQLVAGIDYTKGPYSASVGDFGSVASAHTRLVDDLPAQASATLGSDGYQAIFAGGTAALGASRKLLGALEVSHFDGPWQPGQNFRKLNAALRYVAGDAKDGLAITALAYRSEGGLITDQPERAIEAGLITPYGTLDSSDYSRSARYSLSARYAHGLGSGQWTVSLYAIYSTMALWNNFTHYLDDPINGDQQEQFERRTTLGGATSVSQRFWLAGLELETLAGAQLRYDSVFVDRRHTLGRDTVLPNCAVGLTDGSTLHYAAIRGYCNADEVRLLNIALYAQAVIRWTPWLRSVAGLRYDRIAASDRSIINATGGNGHQGLWQPKFSLILGPFAKSEIYASWGKGFHSNDVRGVFGTVPSTGIPLAVGGTPMLSSTTGFEVGLRSNPIRKLSLQIAAFQQDFRSELTYNADSGQNEAGAPSRRQGIEVSVQYRPFHWLEVNSDLAFSRPRYRTDHLADFGLAEPFIADAPNFIYSLGMLVDGLGGWSGGLQWRRLGTHVLKDGQSSPSDGGFSEWNLNIACALPQGWKAQLGIFNLFNSRSNAADYYYTARLAGEPADGVSGFQSHPMEPRSARLTLSKQF